MRHCLCWAGLPASAVALRMEAQRSGRTDWAGRVAAQVSHRGLQLRSPVENPYSSCEPTRCFTAYSCSPCGESLLQL